MFVNNINKIVHTHTHTIEAATADLTVYHCPPPNFEFIRFWEVRRSSVSRRTCGFCTMIDSYKTLIKTDLQYGRHPSPLGCDDTHVVQPRPEVCEIFQRPLRDYAERDQARYRHAGGVQFGQQRTFDRVVRTQGDLLARLAAERHPVAFGTRQWCHQPAGHTRACVMHLQILFMRTGRDICSAKGAVYSEWRNAVAG